MTKHSHRIKTAPAVPAYVYLARHQHQPRFKVGISIDPLRRLSVLPESRDIDYSRSLQMKLPDFSRAGEVEYGLHLLLRPWQRLGLQGYDGRTEWFDIIAWPVAVSALESLPMSVPISVPVGLRRSPPEPAASLISSSLIATDPPNELRNLLPYGSDPLAPWSAVLRPLTKVLYTVARHCYVEVQRPYGTKGPCQGLRIWDMRGAYTAPMHSLRYAVMDPQLYEVATEQGPRTLLAGPIQWAQQRPVDLLIPLTSPTYWRRHGERGAQVEEALRGIARRLTALGRQWHQGSFVEPCDGIGEIDPAQIPTRDPRPLITMSELAYANRPPARVQTTAANEAVLG